MDDAYSASCLMCGRNLGYISQGRFFSRPGTPTLERVGRQLRCGSCHGSVLFELDATLNPPDWIAVMKREERERPTPRRAVRRRAV